MGKNNKLKNSRVSGESRSVKKINELYKHIDDLLLLSSECLVNSKRKWDDFVKIHSLVQLIISSEPELKWSQAREEGFPELIAWVKSHNGLCDNVNISEFGSMEFGLKAEKDLKLGDLVCDIPRKVMMTVSNAQQSELKQLIAEDPMLQIMHNVTLALFTALETVKGTKSFWHPYIVTLPHKYTTVLYFTLDEIQKLKGTTVFDTAMSQCCSIARQYAYFSKVIRSSADPGCQLLRGCFTYSLYRWAVSTVMTRQNYIPVGNDRVNALIPLWDLCNHADGQLATEFNCETDSSRCVSCHDVPAGGQVLIFYGPRTNAQFLIHNGFVYPENKYDTYKLPLGVAKSDPLYDLRKQLLHLLEIQPSEEFCLRPGPDPVEGKLLAFLRVFNMETEHLQHWIESGRPSDLTCTDCALETKIENKSWNFLAARIQLLLLGYGVDKAVPESTLSDCLRLVELHKQLEVSILTSALEYSRQRVKT